MTEYEVKIDERIAHTLTVEAASQDEAVELAYELLRSGMSPDKETEVDYSMESVGFTGSHDVWEI